MLLLQQYFVIMVVQVVDLVLTNEDLVKIYDLYLKWLRKQDWCEPGCPSYLD